MTKQPAVEAINLHKWFGKVHALRGVDFVAHYGQIVGLVGDNGAGKSTLIKILSGVFPPDDGEMYFEGNKIRLKSPKAALNMGIETIYQETAVVDEMDVMRNIFMGREPVRSIGLIKWLDINLMMVGAIEALGKVGHSLRSPKALVGELSGGQRQGVAIGRAMHFKAKLFILDEPTNNLSVKESQNVLHFVKNLKNQGAASIFITHNLHAVYPIADQIVVLSHGKKIADVKKDETTIEELTNLIITGKTLNSKEKDNDNDF